MKAKIIEDNNENFKPIKIQITLESIEDVSEMFARVHCSTKSIENDFHVKYKGIYSKDTLQREELLTILRNILNEHKR